MTDLLYPKDTLTAQLEHQASTTSNRFPDSRGDFYHSAIVQIRDKVLPIYANIGQAALMREVLGNANRRSGFSYLTDHGPDHIAKVEQRARQILEACKVRLTPYELYYLLAAIWLHDAGMIFGRDGHEHSVAKILVAIGDAAGDTLERRVILSIAAAHSGEAPNSNGDRDTIGQLKHTNNVHGHQVREQLVASVLRFADELADDRTRAARFVLSSHGDKDLLSQSEAFHAYALSLDTVVVNGNDLTVALEFRLNEADCVRKFAKLGSSVFLLDEIFDRAKKCFGELLYCMRFVRVAPEPRTDFAEPAATRVRTLDSVTVSVEVSPDGVAVQPILQLPFVLRETGYPTIAKQEIAAMCPDIAVAMRRWASNAHLPVPSVDRCLRSGPSGKALRSLLRLAANPSEPVKPKKKRTKRKGPAAERADKRKPRKNNTRRRTGPK